MSDMELPTIELEEAFLKLINATRDLTSHCICFFIDGLDEFEGDHWKLAKILKEWTSSSRVKICVSSRPYSDLENSFGTGPETCLRLHTLTYQDMLQAAKSEFESDERLSRFPLGGHYYMPLIKSAVEKSNGVFLWLRLAMRHLLRGMGNQYSVSQLTEILQFIPDDVSDMLQNMLDKVLARPDRVRVAITLLCLSRPTLRAGWRQYVLYFSVMDDILEGTISVDELIRHPLPERYSPSRIEQRIHTTESQLRGRCEDFVDVFDSHAEKKPLPLHRYIEFIHRDVRDFLIQDHVVEKLYKTAGWDPPKYAGLHRYVGVVLLRVVPFLVDCPELMDQLIDDFHDSETTSAEELELLLAVITLNITKGTQVWCAHRHCTILASRRDLYSPYTEKVYYGKPGPENPISFGMRFISAAAFYRHNEFVLRLTTNRPLLLKMGVGSNLLLSASLGGASVQVAYSCAGELLPLLPPTGNLECLVRSDAAFNCGGIGALYPKNPIDMFTDSEGDPGYQMDSFGQTKSRETQKLRKGTTEPLTLAKTLLEQGAPPNLKLTCGIPAWKGVDWTPWTVTLLSLAGIIRRGQLLNVLPDILQLYLSHGADPTICFVGRYLPRHKLKPLEVWRVGPSMYAHPEPGEHIAKLFDHDNWDYLRLAQVVELLEHPKKEAIAGLLRTKAAGQATTTCLGEQSSEPSKIANLGLPELGNCYFFVSMIVKESKLKSLAIPDEARERLLPTGLIHI
ncbi:hypothetical protein F5Y19DRAFT_482009 [Xylariaceae sp. FL1651]|nr:hypothetical protein F5Y19DRAFT_482009 [Xylariaceae sp. FL1651]